MIISIGLGRTGTHSLTAALRDMGLKVCNFDELPPKRFMQWMRGDRTLEECDALVNSPYVRQWMLALADHPSADIVCTTRPRAEWLDSCSQWFDLAQPPKNPDGTLNQWFLRRLFFWGTVSFDRSVFSAVYDEHMHMLRTFPFEPGKLLVLDPSAPNAMTRLEAFVGVPYSGKPFPRENKAKRSRKNR